MQVAQFVQQLAVIFRLDQRQLSESERVYYANAERVFRLQVLKILMMVGVGFHVLSFVIDWFIAEETARTVLLSMHSYIIAIAVPSFYLLRRSPDSLRPWIIASLVLQFASQAYALHLMCQTATILPAKTVGIYLAITMVILTLCPYGGAVPFALAAIGVALGFWAVGAGPVAVRWSSVLVMGVVCSLVVQRYMLVQTLNTARMEFRTMLMMAPAHIVKRSLGSRESLEESFRPERRPCACISINWVDYDHLVYRLSAAEIGALLDAYYALVDRLLAVCISDGAYYCDVMVDEMFIVVFDQQDGATADSLRDAFAFCRRLLEERAAAALPGIRRARIDVGLSSGEALVGIMGPQQHRKTTGLGELPGRAARLKSAAQLIRRAHGTSDRIVLDAASAGRLGGETLKVFDLAAVGKLRDLDVESLHYWERAV